MHTATVHTLLPIKANVQPAARVERGGDGLLGDQDSFKNPLKFLGYGPDGVINRYDPSGRRRRESITAGRIIDLYI